MAVVPGMSRKIKDALVVMLGEIQYGSEPAFVSVLDSTKDAFAGYPAVRILPNDIQSATGTNTERDHSVSYALILHLPLEDADNIEASTYNQMYDLTDLIIDKVEHGDFTHQLTTIDPSIAYFKMDVQNNTWRVASGKAGGMLFANVNVVVSYSRDAS